MHPQTTHALPRLTVARHDRSPARGITLFFSRGRERENTPRDGTMVGEDNCVTASRKTTITRRNEERFDNDHQGRTTDNTPRVDTVQAVI